MFCSKCGTKLTDDAKFCANCGAVVENFTEAEEKENTVAEQSEQVVKTVEVKESESVEEKKEEPAEESAVISEPDTDFSSILEILTDRLPGLHNRKSSSKNAMVGDSLTKKIKDRAAKHIAKKLISADEVLGVVNFSFAKSCRKGIVFTDKAMFVQAKGWKPVCIKYEDMVAVYFKNFVKVEAKNGLNWNIENNLLPDIICENLASIIYNIIEVVKKNPDAYKEDNLKTTEESENGLNFAGCFWPLLIASIIFCWNSYVIFHNFSIHQGYVWAVLGILINLGILIGWFPNFSYLLNFFSKKKIGTVWGFVYFLALFAIFGALGNKPYIQRIEDASVDVVTEILKENYVYGIECKKVKLKKLSKDLYGGVASLSNGRALNVTVTDYDGDFYVQIEY